MRYVKAHKVLLFLLVLIVIATSTTLSPENMQHESPRSSVTTVEVAPMDFSISIDTIGTLDAARSHTISSTIRGDKGKIIYLIPDGSRVEQDEVLIRLIPHPLKRRCAI